MLGGAVFLTRNPIHQRLSVSAPVMLRVTNKRFSAFKEVSVHNFLEGPFFNAFTLEVNYKGLLKTRRLQIQFQTKGLISE